MIALTKLARTLAVPLLLALVAGSLVGCRRHPPEARRGVYTPPRNATEAAYQWRGRKVDFVDRHGETLMRLRERKQGLRVLSPELMPLGQVREAEDTLIAERRSGQPAYLFKRDKVEIVPSAEADPIALEGFAIHKAKAPDEPPERDKGSPRALPEAGEGVGWLVPTHDRGGGWQVLDRDKQPVLTMLPGERAEGASEGDMPWRVTFHAPLEAGEVTWALKASTWKGGRAVSAHLVDEGGRIKEEADVIARSGRLSTLACAPALVTRLDPLMRAGLIHALGKLQRP